MKIDQHVVQRAHGWAVLGEGNQRDTVVLPTQEAAIAQARKIARRSGGELIIHSLNGRIDSPKDSESALRSKS
jgi:hypothetical protein